MMRIIKAIVSVLFLLCCSTFAMQCVFGQTCKKGGIAKVWLSPDKAFSVDAPVDLKRERTTYRNAKLFGAAKLDCVFVIYVYQLSPNKLKLDLKEKVDGLQFVLGGDDDHDFTEAYLEVNGLPAKEIRYTKRINRGLMIDAGERIYILGLTSKNLDDLDSDIANRFFTSFQLLKKAK